jgi:hypothetical protein
MSIIVLKSSELIIKECINIYTLYRAAASLFKALNSVIIKRGRAKVGKLWVFGRKTEDFECLY